MAARPCLFMPRDLDPEDHSMLSMACLSRAEEPQGGMTASCKCRFCKRTCVICH